MKSGGFASQAGGASGFNPFRFVGRVVALLFALIQGVLIARILLDLGIIPAENSFGTFIIVWSDTLAAPVQGIGGGLGGLFGGGVPVGIPPGVPGLPGGELLGGGAGTGFNPTMLAALAGWTAVEWLVMRFVNKLRQV